MRKSVLFLPLLAVGLSLPGFAQTAGAPAKVGVIQFENALISTKDGQKAAAELDAKFAPKRKIVEAKQTELQTMQTQYRNGANTMSEEARAKLQRDIEVKTKLLQRDMDDAQAELEQDQQRILSDLASKMQSVIDKYATERGYSLIIDVSSPQAPVRFASSSIDVTRDIIELYDKSAGTLAPAAAAAPAAKPAAPAKK